MSKKKTPRPKARPCVSCSKAIPASGAYVCAECFNKADQKMTTPYVAGEVAKLVWFAEKVGIDVKALLAEAIWGWWGIEVVRGKPIPEGFRRVFRDTEARRYLALRQAGERGCAGEILAQNPDIFGSEGDVRQQAKRVKKRDETARDPIESARKPEGGEP